ncbi:sulfite exporter TauE/SafE family protein [Crocosphaera sp.]|uniref:sulfite exporter TauE/SafE family protein n=1 Tax=Crocosphaera sp. TaxID=2729996 RepID=UPI002616E265|nr:sulfite exporter TauE/SafE family protein [Crocosphaera sp.]MDJ0583189.1 sulfite exporter TauE/SafE family protein [Crocosphaera sp.]
MLVEILILIVSGLGAGLLSGILGIGGGTVLVPLLLALNYTSLQAIATSSLAIVITSSSGSIQNWRMGYLNFKRVILLGIPALITAQFGVIVANRIPEFVLLTAFGCLLVFNILLSNLRRQLVTTSHQSSEARLSEKLVCLLTGGMAGFLAGLFGIGGGVIMVPLQMLLLQEKIKVAIQTSLGVIVITSISSCFGHALNNNVVWLVGIILGFGGLIGVQISTRFLPKLPDKVVRFCFYGMLAMLSVYTFWKAWNVYNAN